MTAPTVEASLQEARTELKRLKADRPALEELVKQAQAELEAVNPGDTEARIAAQTRVVALEQLLWDHDQDIKAAQWAVDARNGRKRHQDKVNRLADVAAKATAARGKRLQALQQAHEAVRKAAEEAARYELELEHLQQEWGQRGGPHFAYEKRWDVHKKNLVEDVQEQSDLAAVRNPSHALPNPDLGGYSQPVYDAYRTAKMLLKRQREQ